MLRLLTFSFFLGALPTVFIGCLSYFIASRDMEEKVNAGNMLTLAQIQMRVEQTLKSLEKSAAQFANSSLVKAAMNEKLTAGDFRTVHDLTAELGNLQSGEAIISQAYLINLEKEWLLNLNAWKQLDAAGERSEYREWAKRPESIYWISGAAAVQNGASGSADAGAEGRSLNGKGTISLVQMN